MKIRRYKKMERYGGFIEGDYRFEAKVPTTIYDNKRAVVRAYQGKELVDEIYFKLKKMPRWDVPAQTIMLSKSDAKTLEKKTNELIKKLGINRFH